MSVILSMKQDVVDALLKVRNRISNPHSSCPDVTIGYVYQVLAEILAETISDLDVKVDKFVLASVVLSPIKCYARIIDIGCEWLSIAYENKRPTYPNGQNPSILQAYNDEMHKFYEIEDKNQELATNEVQESLERLAGKNLIKIVTNGDDKEYWPV